MKPAYALMAVALVSTTGYAQSQSSPTISSIFAALDADSSGGISPSEAQAHPVVAQSFESTDVNGDGVITYEEFSAAFASQRPDPSQSPAQPHAADSDPEL